MGGRPITIAYSIQLAGRFRIITPDGIEITPRSQKGQGLLALLATVPEMERGRVWLQDKLWSDRGPVEGARSLRQELTQLRKCLNVAHPLLHSDRRSVWLDRSLVKLIKPEPGQSRDLLEGLDVRDSEFNHWLARIRAVVPANEQAALPLSPALPRGKIDRTIALVSSPTADTSQRLAEAEFFDGVTRGLREQMDARILKGLPSPCKPGTMMVSTQVLSFTNAAPSLRVTLDEVDQRGTIWAETLREWDPLQNIALVPRISAMVCRLVDTIAECWAARGQNGWQGCDADAMAHMAVRKIYTVDPAQIDEAEILLRQAFAAEKRGVYQAWLAQLMTFRFVERFSDDRHTLLEQAREASAKALQLEPTNSNVLAAVANATTILERNYVGGGELAQLAVRTNPANAFAWWALSNARQYANDPEGAYDAACRTQFLTANTAFRFWGDFQRALTAAITGRTDEAIRLGEMASVLAPNFRPPLRYLIALYALREENEAARRCIQTLTRKESDFTLEQLLQNPEYPVSVMRQNGLIHPERLRAVGEG